MAQPRRRWPSALLLLGLTGVGPPGESVAQSSQPTFQIDALGRAQAQTLEPVLDTTTRSSQDPVHLIADVDSLPLTGLRRSGVLSLADQLGTLPGIELSGNGGPGASTGIFLRGASAGQTLTLIDGFRVSSVSLGQPVYESLPFGLTERLQVLRGPASGLYGADAIGGVIQLFTPMARPGRSLSGEAALGTAGTRLLGGSVAGGNDSVTGGIELNDDRSDGFDAQRPGSVGHDDDEDGYHRRGVLVHATAQLSAASQVRSVFLRNEIDSDVDDGDFADARMLKRTELIGLTSDTVLADASRLTLKAGRTTDSVDSRSRLATLIEGTQDQFSAALVRPVAPGVQTRLSYDRLSQDVMAQGYSPDAESRTTSSLGISLSGREGPHIVQLSLRRDRSNQYDEQTNGTFAYGYVLASGTRLGGAYATGFRAPGFNDLYLPGYGRADLRPEESRNLELGAYWDQRTPTHPAGWQGKLVLFRHQIDDLIVFSPECPDPDPQYASGCADNVNRARIQGVSLSLGTRTGALTWLIHADWLDPIDQTLDKRLARRARQQLGATAAWQRDALTISASFKAVGDRYDDSSNTVRLGGYATANLSAHYAFGPSFKAFINVVNVADRDYSTAAGFRSPPRTVLVGVRYDTP